MADSESLGPPEAPTGEPARDAKGRAPWSVLEPMDALIGVGMVILGIALTAGVVVALVESQPDQTLIALVPQGIIFAGVPLLVAAQRIRSRPWRALGFVSFRGRDLGLVAAAMGWQIVATLLFTALFFTPEQDTILEDVNYDETTFAVIATVFLVVVAAPITEETLFRGLFFGALRSRTPFWVAAVVSGATFGAVHLGAGDFAVAGLLTLFGVILAWLYERTGSLGPPIILHMVNNSIAIIPLLSQ